MYLSLLSLDRLHRGTMRLLSDIYLLHKGIMSGFTRCGDGLRVLFRVEPENDDRIVRIMVQSDGSPSWELFTERHPCVIDMRTKVFSPALRAGHSYRFRLRANPAVKRNGKRYGLIRDETLEEWLRRKEPALGLQFRSVLALDEGYVTGHKEGSGHPQRINIKTARFEGILTVSEPHLVQNALCCGIGPAKAFGCGLLSLARV
ncbi:type I-E CRISPR-associated protein Cas6/Cse3/CasE [Syntrophobacter fumaroxidans]|uniref:CRISPR-associated protein, Cse3 family n=1 Tax=Syntrophobacter fumaroxidans (strain DSM 10017 / MPOB) TaxID=335543 RepID=A0LM55_SYNFM|nr:type I-E CRISPR-associated protein Cas6/Cse3/CasE [Syntrophobacter fumaroxidans]ABK18507.1 CRISPR-associated protein, Cse3 family [Syntrophobacter fumaroxidans MPOB]